MEQNSVVRMYLHVNLRANLLRHGLRQPQAQSRTGHFFRRLGSVIALEHHVGVWRTGFADFIFNFKAHHIRIFLTLSVNA